MEREEWPGTPMPVVHAADLWVEPTSATAEDRFEFGGGEDSIKRVAPTLVTSHLECRDSRDEGYANPRISAQVLCRPCRKGRQRQKKGAKTDFGKERQAVQVTLMLFSLSSSPHCSCEI